jgi:hypothetical protein
MFKDFKSLLNINWIYFFLLLIIFWIGEINLYSAAGGNLEPWAIESIKKIHYIFTYRIFYFVTPAKIYF